MKLNKRCEHNTIHVSVGRQKQLKFELIRFVKMCMVKELVQEDKECDVVICQIKGDLQEIVKFWLVG